MTPTTAAIVTVDKTDAVLPQELQVPADLSVKARQLAASTAVDPRRPETITAIGAVTQQKSAKMSDDLIGHVKNKDAGEAGKLLGQMNMKCKGIDVSKLRKSNQSMMSKIPGIGHFFDVVASYEPVLNDLDSITAKLTTASQTLSADVTSLSTLYDQNLEIYRELLVWVEVCKLKGQEMDKQIADAKSKAGTDPLAAQAINDLANSRQQLDNHQNDLELTATVRLQFAPKVRIVQAGDVVLVNKLTSSVMNTLPIWKDNIALAIAQTRQKEAADLSDAVDDTTNALLRQGADMLHTNAVQIAKAAQRGPVDIETLQYTTTQLIATLDETQKIAEDGVKARENSRAAMEKMNSDLGSRLIKAAA